MIRHSFLLWMFLVLADSLSGQTTTPGVAAPADWAEEGLTIRLKDNLKHPLFSWPLTRLRYRLDFGEAGPAMNELCLLDLASGNPVPFQLAETEIRNGRIRKAVLMFSSDLPANGDKTFRLVKGQSPEPKISGTVTTVENDDRIILSNGKVRVEIPAGKDPGLMEPPVGRFGTAGTWLGRGEMQLALPLSRRTVTGVNKGPVLAEYEIKYEFNGNKSYTVNLKLAEGMEFVEMEEKMTGFREEDQLAWRLLWDGLQPDTRYFATRNETLRDKKGKGYANIGWEPMEGTEGSPDAEKHPYLDFDQRNREDGKLPFRIAVYDNWMSWWRLPTAAFWSEKQGITAGVFVKDMEKWNDGNYPLWGSKENLSIYFHWKNKLLDFTFPLVTGTRSTALTAYDHRKDIELIDTTGIPLAYVDYLRRWYGWIPLDKVRTWVLDYEGGKGAYPKYFKPENASGSMGLSNLETSLFNSLRSIARDSERRKGPTPVGTREFYSSIAPSFDINAPEMSPEQFKRLRAWFLFNTYVFMDEALMPMRTMLSGHPNFLADIKGVAGLAAVLFPGHPQAREMADHFEKFVELNFRYHIRPGVPAWQARGGRWTENLATYTWAALKPTLRPSYLLHHYFDGRNPILQPGVSSYAGWLLNALTSPLELAGNRRVFPPQGAHSRTHGGGPPSLFRLLGQELMYYDPLLAEGLLYVSTAGDNPFESTKEKDRMWGELLKGEWENNTGTNPHLQSAKYTGYGFVLRSGFGTKEEMYVNLQQIDEGPNYRWGRAGRGGNGVIYYYAQGKRYSHNGAEDIGDGPFGDVERATNFGVKKAPGYRDIGPYRSVGRNELTEPLFDFGFAQMATVKANDAVAPDYLSRSVMQSGADYIAIFDDVGHDTVEGRFSWFVGIEDNFPVIHQIAPGAGFADADIRPSQSNYHKDPEVLPTKGRYYDGKGDFLTVVTHKPGIKVARTPYGCQVFKENGLTDHVFRSDSSLEYHRKDVRFKGTAGLVQEGTGKNEYAAALFTGSRLAAAGLEISLPEHNSTGIGFRTLAGGYKGKVQSLRGEELIFTIAGRQSKKYRFYLDGKLLAENPTKENTLKVHIPAGTHTWQLTTGGVIPEAPRILSTVNQSGGAQVEWESVAGAGTYRVQLSEDGGISWTDVADNIAGTTFTLSGLTNNAKVHVRIIAKGTGGESGPSNEYPVYVTSQAPHAPEGLRVNIHGPDIEITWGEILGAGRYHLYRREKKPLDKTFIGGYERVYSGPAREYKDKKPDTPLVYEYVVTAENGNGESQKSSGADTDPQRFLHWDPRPGEGFRRDTEDHENGFSEFNPFVEDKTPVLSYPRTTRGIK